MPIGTHTLPQRSTLVRSDSNERRQESRRVFFTDTRSTQTDPPRRFPFTNTSLLVDPTTAAISSNGNLSSSRNVYALRPSSKGDMRIVSSWSHRRHRRTLQRHGFTRAHRQSSQSNNDHNSRISTDRRGRWQAGARQPNGVSQVRMQERQQQQQQQEQNSQMSAKQQTGNNITFVPIATVSSMGGGPSKLDISKLKGSVGGLKRSLGANRICFGQDTVGPRDTSMTTEGTSNVTDTTMSDTAMISRATQTSSLS